MVFDVTRREFVLVNVSASLGALIQTRFGQELSDGERKTLLVIAVTLFPSKGVNTSVYERAVDSVDRRCGTDVKKFDAITSGVAALEWTCGGKFTTCSPRTRFLALQEIESSQFFRLVYRELLEALYGPQDTWSLLVGSPT